MGGGGGGGGRGGGGGGGGGGGCVQPWPLSDNGHVVDAAVIIADRIGLFSYN